MVIVTGQEGAGKSTLVRALLPHTPRGARIDAEDLGQVNPWVMDDAFGELLRANVAALAENFWRAGYRTVLAGSFLDDHAEYLRFRPLVDTDAHMYVVQLCAAKPVRDLRRVRRSKPSSPQWRDRVDLACPEDASLAAAPGADYRYLRIDNDAETVAESVRRIAAAFPEVFSG